MEIKVGDIVKLKSGGPDMFVKTEGHPTDKKGKSPTISCIWFGTGNKQRKGSFPAHALELAEDIAK